MPNPVCSFLSGRSRSAGRNASSFTLVELLVVVTVIVILLVLLLPALRKARDTARLVGCMSNARQVTLAVMTYANDFDGYGPAYIRDDGAQEYPMFLGPYFGTPQPTKKVDNIQKFSKVYPILKCPATPAQKAGTWSYPGGIVNEWGRLISSYSLYFGKGDASSGENKTPGSDGLTEMERIKLGTGFNIRRGHMLAPQHLSQLGKIIKIASGQERIIHKPIWQPMAQCAVQIQDGKLSPTGTHSKGRYTNSLFMDMHGETFNRSRMWKLYLGSDVNLSSIDLSRTTPHVARFRYNTILFSGYEKP